MLRSEAKAQVPLREHVVGKVVSVRLYVHLYVMRPNGSAKEITESTTERQWAQARDSITGTEGAPGPSSPPHALVRTEASAHFYSDACQ